MPRVCGIQIPKLVRCHHNRAGVVKLRPENPAVPYASEGHADRASLARARAVLAAPTEHSGLSRRAHSTRFGCGGGGKIEAGGKGEFLDGIIGLTKLRESLAAAQMQVASVRRKIVRGIKFGDGVADIAFTQQRFAPQLRTPGIEPTARRFAALRVLGHKAVLPVNVGSAMLARFKKFSLSAY